MDDEDVEILTGNVSELPPIPPVSETDNSVCVQSLVSVRFLAKQFAKAMSIDNPDSTVASNEASASPEASSKGKVPTKRVSRLLRILLSSYFANLSFSFSIRSSRSAPK